MLRILDSDWPKCVDPFPITAALTVVLAAWFVFIALALICYSSYGNSIHSDSQRIQLSYLLTFYGTDSLPLLGFPTQVLLQSYSAGFSSAPRKWKKLEPGDRMAV